VLLVLALAWIPFGLAYLLLQNLLLGIHEVRAYNKIELINQIVGVILIGLVILAGIVRAEIVFSSGLAALLAGFFLALRALRQHLKEFPMPSMSLFKKNIRYGIRAYLAAFFAFLVLRIDLLMIKYILGAEQAGYYSIAVSMADMINMLPVVVGTILFPKLSALINNDAKWNIAKKTALGVGIMMIILTSCAALLAKPAITILFGKSFMPAVPAFIWLMPGIVFLSINIIYMNYFASTGMPSITIYSPAIAALCNILLNLKLIPLLGIVGASFSSVFSYGIMLGGSVLYISYGKRK
jgi:O-antigen/teichoic acid export membrane protein